MYLEADDLDNFSHNGKELTSEQLKDLMALFNHDDNSIYHQEVKYILLNEFKKRKEYRHYVINHLNQSLFVSSPMGRLVSYTKAFLDKNVELKN